MLPPAMQSLFDLIVMEPPASKGGFQMQEQFGAKDPRVKILSFGPTF
jgi:hypothetical protein